MRADRIVNRNRLRLSVKERAKKIKELVATAYIKGAVAGRDSVLHAADHLTYEEDGDEVLGVISTGVAHCSDPTSDSFPDPNPSNVPE